MLDDATLDAAVKRIGLTADGKLFRLKLQRFLMARAPSIKVGALRAHEGKRILAAEIIALLDEGAPAEPMRDRTDADQPVASPKPGPVSYAEPSARRRVKPYSDAEPGT